MVVVELSNGELETSMESLRKKFWYVKSSESELCQKVFQICKNKINFESKSKNIEVAKQGTERVRDSSTEQIY